MSAAFGPFANLPRFRAVGADRFQASCPTAAHPHGDRSRGLSGRIFGNKIALICFAGCSIEEILKARGLHWSALFTNSLAQRTPWHRNRNAELPQDAVPDGEWRETEMNRCAIELRDRDHIIRLVNNCVFAGLLTEKEATPMHAYQLKGYCALERRFETLRTGTPVEVAELWSVTNVE